MDPEFRKLVKDALEHLYDTAHLQVHPLLTQMTDVTPVDQKTRAQRLRGILKDAIEALRPQQSSSSFSPEWRSYLALRYHYVQGMSLGETADELGISIRQLQRELHKGLDALSQLLWDMRVGNASLLPETQPDRNELQELQNELSQWQLTRQPCELGALIQDTLLILKPILEQHGCAIRVSLPDDLPPVLVDPTLTNQALLKLLRLMLQGSTAISISADRQHQYIDIVLRAEHGNITPAAADWQMVELLLCHQGGRLAIRKQQDGTSLVAVSLPLNQRRVLVIDDNQAILQLFERYLASQQYEVIHAYSGQEALQLAAETRPDIITLDVMMPTIDGWQVLRNLTKDSITKDIPIVVCSVLQEPDLALSLGARAYLKKPVDRVELLTTLAQLCLTVDPAPASHPPAQPDN